MIKEKEYNKDIVIDLDGSQGNAFYLIGFVHKAIKDELIRDHVIKQMKSGDYINLLKTFDKYLGHVVTLETNQENLLKELA
ncbi:MAG: hypothetical protein CBE14_001925 [Rickettsiales bacterium TMED254]|nr:MAG: hypothetical protein CBE14_001925 [Rickettsiales bacterium TMED254]